MGGAARIFSVFSNTIGSRQICAYSFRSKFSRVESLIIRRAIRFAGKQPISSPTLQFTLNIDVKEKKVIYHDLEANCVWKEEPGRLPSSPTDVEKVSITDHVTESSLGLSVGPGPTGVPLRLRPSVDDAKKCRRL